MTQLPLSTLRRTLGMFARTALPSRWIAAFAIALVCAVGATGLNSSSLAFAGQKKGKGGEKPAAAKGTPTLWRNPGDIASLDLYWGIGGADKAPKPPFKFVKEDTTGTNPKIKV